MKVKLDDYEVRVLINGLVQQHRSYDEETNSQIDALALRLCDIAEAMKPGPYGVAKPRDTGEKARCCGCLK